MLKHVVVMKFKSGASEDDVKDLEKGLGSLPGVIPEIKQFEFGRDLRPERSFDFCLVSAFDDVGALKRYQGHPDHVVVLKKVRSLCESVQAADFEW